MRRIVLLDSSPLGLLSHPRKHPEIKAWVQALIKAGFVVPEFWAKARQQGQPTADDRALDGDVILAAQAAEIKDLGYDVVIAASNVKHLSRFVTAQNWEEIGL